MTPKQLLNALVEDIANITGRTTSDKEAKEKGQQSFLYLEYSSVYGGYRLICVNVTTGGHGSLPGMSSAEGRKKAKEMETYLRGILIGLNMPKK